MENISEQKAWEVIKPICRELYELVDSQNLKFISGEYNDTTSSYKINLSSSKLHFASRGFKDSIGDIEYSGGKIRIGSRANGIPINIFVDLK
ncbi:MAG: hypothetical protein ACPKQO_04265 [Nitrososphaeraceae archaeon]